MTIRRCIVDPTPKFRVSKPGADVNSDSLSDFMLHEQFLSAQPYFFAFVACPFAGYSGNSSKYEIVSLTVPDVTDDPVALVFPVSNVSIIIWPKPRDSGSGNDQNGYNVDDWRVYAGVVSSTQVDVYFSKTVDGKKSPDGCYLVLVRKS